MRRISKAVIAIGLSVAILPLSGCAQINDYISSEVEKESERTIHNLENYKQYERYQSDGLLADDGLFPIQEISESDSQPSRERQVRVTIATNSFLNCTYYAGEAKTPVEGTEVFLSPGESLYVENVSVANDISNLYDFSRFRIWSYDQNGRRSSAPYCEVDNRTGAILTVPDEFKDSGFAIEPLGAYTNRHISASAFYMNEGQQISLPNGRWEVNKEPFSGNTDISPVDSYTIEYCYEPYKDDYYFVNSVPNCWYPREKEYTSVFREVSSNDQETEFVVEMHPFITLSVSNTCMNLLGTNGKDIIQSIYKNGEAIGQEFLNQAEFSIQKLKVGDTITVRVGKEYKITGTGVNAGTAVPLASSAENGYEYTIVVPDTRDGISIEIAERNSNTEGRYLGYNLANADIIVTRANGSVLRQGEELPGDNETVTLSIVPHKGYFIEGFNDDRDYSFVKEKIKYSKLEQDISKMMRDHPAVRFITLNLVFADNEGTFVYELDGKEVNRSPLTNVRPGQTLKVTYSASKGYVITHSWAGNLWRDAKTLVGGVDSISESIKITSAMDNTTVDREAFGIAVEKAG